MNVYRVYKVYWAISGADCEKDVTYVFAETAHEAVRLPMFRNVLVLDVRPVYGNEKKEAIEYGWCANRAR